MFRWAPSKNPSVIRNNKDPPAPSLPYPLPRQSFTLAGGHRSSQWPSYPSTPATCPGNDHRPGLALVFSIASASSLSARHPTEENKHTPTPLSICTPIRLAAYAQHRRIPSARVTLRREIVPSHSLNVPDPPPRFLTIARCVVLFFKPFPFSLLASAIVSSTRCSMLRYESVRHFGIDILIYETSIDNCVAYDDVHDVATMTLYSANRIELNVYSHERSHRVNHKVKQVRSQTVFQGIVSRWELVRFRN